VTERSTRLDLPVGVAAPAAARRAVRRLFESRHLTDPDWLDDALTVVSELVSNAVRHGDGCPVLWVGTDAGRVTLTVTDRSARRPHRRAADETGGRGLAIVEAMAESWGVEDAGDGKAVWARLPRYPGPVPGAGAATTEGAGPVHPVRRTEQPQRQGR
jgi:anti-sigma regulatory factor (Ser/Thr protein kinase)